MTRDRARDVYASRAPSFFLHKEDESTRMTKDRASSSMRHIRILSQVCFFFSLSFHSTNIYVQTMQYETVPNCHDNDNGPRHLTYDHHAPPHTFHFDATTMWQPCHITTTHRTISTQWGVHQCTQRGCLRPPPSLHPTTTTSDGTLFFLLVSLLVQQFLFFFCCSTYHY